MWVIKKEVESNKYYWNNHNNRWEGLIDNATKFEDKKNADAICFWIKLDKIFCEVEPIKNNE